MGVREEFFTELPAAADGAGGVGLAWRQVEVVFMKIKPWIPRAGARGGKGFLFLCVRKGDMEIEEIGR